MRFLIDLDGPDEKTVFRVLRALLKRLIRDHKIKCVAITTQDSEP